MTLFRFANKAMTRVLFWREILVQRAELSRMSDDLLKDIGLSRAEAIHEANRYFWDTAPVEDKSYRTKPYVKLNLKYN